MCRFPPLSFHYYVTFFLVVCMMYAYSQPKDFCGRTSLLLLHPITAQPEED